MTGVYEKAVHLHWPVLWAVVAIAGLVVVNAPDSGLIPTQDRLILKAISLGAVLLFVIGGVAATRRIAGYVDARLRRRGLGSAGSVFGVIISAVGYCVVVLTALSLTAIPLQQLVVGEALTGIVVAAIGVVLAFLGSNGRMVGGRAHWY